MAGRFRLSKLKIDEISLVPSGDNHGAIVVLSKAAAEDMADNEMPKMELSKEFVYSELCKIPKRAGYVWIASHHTARGKVNGHWRKALGAGDKAKAAAKEQRIKAARITEQKFKRHLKYNLTPWQKKQNALRRAGKPLMEN